MFLFSAFFILQILFYLKSKFPNIALPWTMMPRTLLRRTVFVVFTFSGTVKPILFRGATFECSLVIPLDSYRKLRSLAAADLAKSSFNKGSVFPVIVKLARL